MATGRRIRGETTELTDTHTERERERESEREQEASNRALQCATNLMSTVCR